VQAVEAAHALPAVPAPDLDERPVAPIHVGRYRLGPRLGTGGMAEVFRATLVGAEGFERTCALKRIAPELSADADFARMFIDEARLSAQLHHTGIVATLDFDRDTDGRLYLTLELVEGCTLRHLMESGPLPIGLAAHVAAELLAALAHAHELRDPHGKRLLIVHRDVSPHNVLVSWEGEVKLGDFGLAKAYGAAGAVHSGSLRGKVAYMSPEQARREPLDERSDLFAVGVILHEMLSGRRLFGGTQVESFARLLTMAIPSVCALRPDVPPALDTVVARLLERDVNRRPPSARAALDELFAAGAPSLRGGVELAQLVRERVRAPGS
jgi:serine/threonine protein kinase